MAQNPQDLKTAMSYADNAENTMWFSKSIGGHEGVAPGDSHSRIG